MMQPREVEYDSQGSRCLRADIYFHTFIDCIYCTDCQVNYSRKFSSFCCNLSNKNYLKNKESSNGLGFLELLRGENTEFRSMSNFLGSDKLVTTLDLLIVSCCKLLRSRPEFS